MYVHVIQAVGYFCTLLYINILTHLYFRMKKGDQHELYHRAAEQGDVNAQYILAMLIELE